jgi:hypothetical protein
MVDCRTARIRFSCEVKISINPKEPALYVLALFIVANFELVRHRHSVNHVNHAIFLKNVGNRNI